MSPIKWKQSINQNVVVLIISMFAAGITGYYALVILEIISFVFVVVAGWSVIKCLIAYTRNYCANKQNKSEIYTEGNNHEKV